MPTLNPWDFFQFRDFGKREAYYFLQFLLTPKSSTKMAEDALNDFLGLSQILRHPWCRDEPRDACYLLPIFLSPFGPLPRKGTDPITNLDEILVSRLY